MSLPTTATTAVAVAATLFASASPGSPAHRSTHELGGSSQAAAVPVTSTSPVPRATFGLRSLATAPRPAVTKVLTIVEENHSLAQMRAKMPYLFGLAKRFAYASNWRSITHPSLPDYLAMVGGSTFGVHDDKNPRAHRISGPTVFDQAIRRGKTAKTYAEGMPSRCYLKNSGRYAVRHNPWTYFVDSRARCRAHDLRLAALSPRRLPNVGMVIPDICHDAHNCPLAVADGWLRNLLPTLLTSPAFRSGHLTVVVTADEDDHHSGNKVLTVVMNQRLSGVVVRSPLNHYSLTRYIDQVIGAKPLRKAASAPNMRRAFRL
jgi:Phosphoesterase family